MVVDVVSTTKPRHVVSTSLSSGRWRRERRASSRVDASPPTAGRRAAPFSSLVGDDVDDASGRRRRATLLYTSILARLISTRAASRSMFVCCKHPTSRALARECFRSRAPPLARGSRRVRRWGHPRVLTRQRSSPLRRHRSVVTRRVDSGLGRRRGAVRVRRASGWIEIRLVVASSRSVARAVDPLEVV